ncbi:nucleoside 2-deoxyribosyltransferase [Leptospira abararensis]|uniref:nucleoside 2-deoxyribosyltransferase n=1 Tax=Leptospira abararensis TaxID=2810036 RepID=UPI001E3FB0EE|nr:nucleoside 2-deoxyribosyltransferase [Leptospira abararensis]
MNIENIFNINWSKKEILGDTLTTLNSFTDEKLGTIFITYEAFSNEYGRIETSVYYKFISVLRMFYLNGKKILICEEKQKKNQSTYTNKEITFITFDEILNYYPENLAEKQKLSLLNLSKIEVNYGSYISEIEPNDVFAKDNKELIFYLNILLEKNLILHDMSLTGNGQLTVKKGILIKESGWIEIEKNIKSENSKQVFVAMWFDPSMDKAYNEIEKACKDNNFRAFKINSKEHNNEISGEILYEIRKSKFLIAEVTGQRPGVYFEAGYAMGLNIPVIFCVKKNEIDEVHFDTRQYNHVVWESESELYEKLHNRIKGSIL